MKDVENLRRPKGAFSLGSGLAIATAMLAAPAVAQTSAPDESESGIEDIVVTAQKREESISKVGLSIVAVSGDMLEARNITSAEDLIRVVPGFTYADSGQNTPVYSVRGVGFNDTSLAASPTVSVYVDQVALPYSAMTQGATLDLQRVEVLKGPQGTLFGQNATAGAINYIARKPTDTLEAGITGTFGRFSMGEVNGFISGPLADGLKARIAVSREIGGNWQRSLTRPNDELGEVSRGAGRLILEWDPTADLKLTFNANGWYDHSDGRAAQLVRVDFSSPNPAFQFPEVRNAPIGPDNARLADWDPAFKPKKNDRLYQLSGRADWKLGDIATLTSISAYSHYRTDTVADPDGVAASSAQFVFDGDIKTFNQELRVSGDVDRLRWMLGGAYSRDKVRDDYPIQDYPTSSAAQNLFGVRLLRGQVKTFQEVRSSAIFANGEYQITDSLKAIGGIRYTKEKRDFEGCGLDTGNGIYALAFGRLQQFFSGGRTPTTPFLPGQCITLGPPPLYSPTLIQVELKEDNISWNAGLNFAPTSSSLIYGRVSKGYKSGSYPALGYTLAEQATPVTQESVMAYEVGFKATLFDRRLRLEGALFHYDYTDKQLKTKRLIPPFGPLNALQNVPKSRVQGAELSAVAEPAAGITLNAGITYVKTEVTEFSGFDPDGIFRNLAGVEFNFSQRWQILTGAAYEWAIGSSLTAFTGADLAYRSSSTAAIGGSAAYDLKSYALLDLRVGIHGPDRQWSLSIWGKNVTNSFYVTNAVRYTDTIARFPGRPATYGITGSLRFR